MIHDKPSSKPKGIIATLALLTIAFSGCVTSEQRRQAPIGVSLMSEYAWPDADEFAITGVQLGVVGGRHQVTGVDVGVLPAADAMGGVQLGLVAAYTRRELLGLQVAPFCTLAGNLLTGDREDAAAVGIQASALAAANSGPLTGAQLSLTNFTDVLYGLQVGMINVVKDSGAFLAEDEGPASTSRAIQIGALSNNSRGCFVGLQCAGLYNDAESLRGVQIGLLNRNRDGWLPFFPLINVGW